MTATLINYARTCCRKQDGTIVDLSPPKESGINVRTTAHEYGGGDFTVVPDENAVFFVNFKCARSLLFTRALMMHAADCASQAHGMLGREFALVLLGRSARWEAGLHLRPPPACRPQCARMQRSIHASMQS